MSVFNNPQVVSCINMMQISVSDSGYGQVGPEWNKTDVCSPYSKIYYVRGGCGRLISAGRETLMLPGRIYLIPIGYHYDYSCDVQFDHLYFHFNIPQNTGLDLFSACSYVMDLPVSISDLDKLIRLYHTRDNQGALSTATRLYHDVTRFVALQHTMQQTPSQTYTELLQRLFPLIHEKLSSKLTINALAAQLNVSPSTLTKRFHHEVGTPLGEYVDRMLFQRAQFLLITTEHSIGEISEQLEFCDQFYFSRFFKQHQGETPTSYRKRLKT